MLLAGSLAFRGCQQASKSGHSNYQNFTFVTYFGLRQDIWFLEVARRLPKVVTALTRFLRLEHIFAFGWIFAGGPRLLGILSNLRL